jgi:hypothetical protein
MNDRLHEGVDLCLRRIERGAPVRIAAVGPAGTPSEAAAQSLATSLACRGYEHVRVELHPTHEQCAQRVLAGRAALLVVANDGAPTAELYLDPRLRLAAAFVRDTPAYGLAAPAARCDDAPALAVATSAALAVATSAALAVATSAAPAVATSAALAVATSAAPAVGRPAAPVRIAAHSALAPLIGQLLPNGLRVAEIRGHASAEAAAADAAAGGADLALTTRSAARPYGLSFLSQVRSIRMLWSVFGDAAALGDLPHPAAGPRLAAA